MNATLIVHAAAKESHVDGYARLFTANEVSSISVGRKRNGQAMDADEHILRANKLAKETRLADSVLSIARFHLFDRLTRLVYKCDPNKTTPEVDGNFTTFESISAAFVGELLALSPQGERPNAIQQPSESATEDPPNFVEYDAEGRAIGQGKATLLGMGFKVGTLVESAKSKTEEQWEITSITQDGDVAFRRTVLEGTAGGSALVSPLKEFTKRFKECKRQEG